MLPCVKRSKELKSGGKGFEQCPTSQMGALALRPKSILGLGSLSTFLVLLRK